MKTPDINCVFESEDYKSNKKYLQSLFCDALSHEKIVLCNTDYEALAELCELNLFYDGSEIDEKK